MHTVSFKSLLNSVQYRMLLSLIGKKTPFKSHLGSLLPSVSLRTPEKKVQTGIHHICSLPEIYSLKLCPDTENGNKSRKRRRQEREEKQPSIFYTEEKTAI